MSEVVEQSLPQRAPMIHYSGCVGVHMRRLLDTITIGDGSVLRAMECDTCGAKRWIGLDAKGFLNVHDRTKEP